MKITSLIQENNVLCWSKNGQNSMSTKLLPEMPKSRTCQYFIIPWAFSPPKIMKKGPPKVAPGGPFGRQIQVQDFQIFVENRISRFYT